jgi:hypothetical protein
MAFGCMIIHAFSYFNRFSSTVSLHQKILSPGTSHGEISYQSKGVVENENYKGK